MAEVKKKKAVAEKKVVSLPLSANAINKKRLSDLRNEIARANSGKKDA